jgi:tetratricopeptide (TPR) repeat protein
MSRVTSLTEMSEAQLNRWIKRIGLLLIVGIVAFVAFYAIDRFRVSPAPIVDQELAILEEAVRADPADTVARGQLADVYLAKRRYEDAIVQYSALVDANKDVMLAKLGRARAYQATEQYDAAVADYRAVIEIASTGEMAVVDPNLAAAWYGVGTIALAQGKPADAIEPLTNALAIQRADADVLNALGTAYLQTGDSARAIEKLELAVRLVPVGWAEPYANLEAAYKAAGEADLAEWAGAMGAMIAGDEVMAEKRLLALVDGPHALEATLGLGLLSETRGDTAAAADWYGKALAIDPDNTSARLGMGRVALPAEASAAPSASGSN